MIEMALETKDLKQIHKFLNICLFNSKLLSYIINDIMDYSQIILKNSGLKLNIE